jgi:WD40 repeat protein
MDLLGDLIATGAKDKSVAVTSLSPSSNKIDVLWRGEHHERVVKSVALSRKSPTLVASCGDDGLVAVNDFRQKPPTGSCSVEIEGHASPHSVVWGDGCMSEHVLMTAGRCGDAIKLWDLRSPKEPT